MIACFHMCVYLTLKCNSRNKRSYANKRSVFTLHVYVCLCIDSAFFYVLFTERIVLSGTINNTCQNLSNRFNLFSLMKYFLGGLGTSSLDIRGLGTRFYFIMV